MEIKQDNIRKIIMGESFTHSIKYQVDSKYRQPSGLCTLVNFIKVGDPEHPDLEIYLNNGDDTYLWKTISNKMILEVEYDSSF